MICVRCGGTMRVLDTANRPGGGLVLRQYRCEGCGFLGFGQEKMVAVAAMRKAHQLLHRWRKGRPSPGGAKAAAT